MLFQIDGEKEFSFDLAKLMGVSDFAYSRLTVDAKFTEDVTGERKTFRQSYYIGGGGRIYPQFDSSTPGFFKPGIPYEAVVCGTSTPSISNGFFLNTIFYHAALHNPESDLTDIFCIIYSNYVHKIMEYIEKGENTHMGTFISN